MAPERAHHMFDRLWEEEEEAGKFGRFGKLGKLGKSGKAIISGDSDGGNSGDWS